MFRRAILPNLVRRARKKVKTPLTKRSLKKKPLLLRKHLKMEPKILRKVTNKRKKRSLKRMKTRFTPPKSVKNTGKR